MNLAQNNIYYKNNIIKLLKNLYFVEILTIFMFL